MKARSYFLCFSWCENVAKGSSFFSYCCLYFDSMGTDTEAESRRLDDWKKGIDSSFFDHEILTSLQYYFEWANLKVTPLPETPEGILSFRRAWHCRSVSRRLRPEVPRAARTISIAPLPTPRYVSGNVHVEPEEKVEVGLQVNYIFKW